MVEEFARRAKGTQPCFLLFQKDLMRNPFPFPRPCVLKEKGRTLKFLMYSGMRIAISIVEGCELEREKNCD